MKVSESVLMGGLQTLAAKLRKEKREYEAKEWPCCIKLPLLAWEKVRCQGGVSQEEEEEEEEPVQVGGQFNMNSFYL